MARVISKKKDPKQNTVKVILPTPKPIIIFPGEDLAGWEKHFKEMMNTYTSLPDKHDYAQCHSTLKWAGFCGAKRLRLRVGKELDTPTVEINFYFTTSKHLDLFFNELEKVLDVITPN